MAESRRPSEPSPAAPRAAGSWPWYLVVALVAGWFYGMDALNQGVAAVSFFRGETVDIQQLTEGIGDPKVHDLAVAAGQQWVSLWIAARDRAMPLGIGAETLLSGLIVLALTRPRARAFFREASSGPLGQA